MSGVHRLRAYLESEKRRLRDLGAPATLTAAEDEQINSILQSIGASLAGLTSSALSVPVADKPRYLGLITEAQLQVTYLLQLLKASVLASTQHERELPSAGDAPDSNPRLLTSGRNVQLLVPLRGRHSQELNSLSPTGLCTNGTSTVSETRLGMNAAIIRSGLVTDPSILQLLASSDLGQYTAPSDSRVYSAHLQQFFKPLKKIVQNSESLQALEVQETVDVPMMVIPVANTNAEQARVNSSPETSSTQRPVVTRESENISSYSQGFSPISVGTSVGLMLTLSAAIAFALFSVLSILGHRTSRAAASSSTVDLLYKIRGANDLSMMLQYSLVLLVTGVASTSASCAPLRRTPTLHDKARGYLASSLPSSQGFLGLFDILSA